MKLNPSLGTFILPNPTSPKRKQEPSRNWRKIKRESYWLPTRGFHGGYGQGRIHKEVWRVIKQFTYKEIPTDPTTKYKNRLINLLKSIKPEGGINDTTYRRLYPTGAGSPKYYGLSKVYKKGMPLRPIISSRGSATYETGKELARILKPLVARSPTMSRTPRTLLRA